ncbi:MAG: hypothetical protein GY943_21280 [Chloroflexi bacterium]|nr:hypothetical protein [Chloroflexota bacterium]
MMTDDKGVEKKSQPKWRQVLLSILMTTLFTLIAVVFAIEIGLRQFYTLIPIDVCAADDLIGTYDCQPYFEYDDPIRIGYRYEPGFRLEGMWDPASPFLANAGDETAPSERSDAFWYAFETDEMGFPNSQYEWQDKYDIILAGDSFTIRTAPVTWIERMQEKSGQDILTLGAPSWSTLNQAEAIRMYGLDKNPDWVILMFFEGNDLINTAQYLERKDSGLDWKAYDMQGATWTERLITPHLLTYFMAQISPEDDVESEPKTYRYPVTFSSEAGEIDTVLKDIHLLPISADYDTLARSDEFAVVGDTLIALRDEVEAQGGRFLMVYIPSKEHVLWQRIWDPVDVNNILERTVTVSLSNGDNGRLVHDLNYLSYDQFTANHNAQEQLFFDFTVEENIEFLNLTPLFFAETIAQGELYHYADPHWNQVGNNLAADAILEYLEQAKLP